MPIVWDQHQVVSIINRVEERCALVQGELLVEQMDGMPDNCFAGYVNLKEKQFCVFTNIDNPMGDVSMTILLGYVVAMAYDREGWLCDPNAESLRECHDLVCDAMEDFNQEVSDALQDNLDMLEEWLEVHSQREDLEENGTEMATASVADDVDELGLSWFRKNDDKDWLN